jgi:hypothetical protein
MTMAPEFEVIDEHHWQVDKGAARRHIEEFLIDEDDLLVVFNREQGLHFRQFAPSQVYALHSAGFLCGKRPARVFRAGLGNSRQSWGLRGLLEKMHWDVGTELYRLYDDGTVIPA